MPGNTWTLSEEICESTALDMIERDSITEDVRMEGFASIVLDLMVGLRSTLGGVGAGTGVKAGTEGIQRNPSVGKGKTTSQRRIHYLVLKLHVRETDSVIEAPCVEVRAHHVSAGDIFVRKDRVAKAKICGQRVREVIVAIEETCVVAEIVVGPPH